MTKAALYTKTDDLFLAEKATAIRALTAKVGRDLVEIGKHLTEAKARTGHGRWLLWLKNEFGWTEQSALNFIRVYELSHSKSKTILDLNLPLRTICLLAAPSTPETAQTEVIERAKSGEHLKHDDVKAIVNKTKPSNDFGLEESADRRKDEAEAAAEPARKPRRAAEPKIDSDPIEATDPLRDVPRAKWRDLMLARRQFLEIQLSSDCRHLVEFVNDAELMFEALGFSSPKQMIIEGYGLEREEISIAVEWLRLRELHTAPEPPTPAGDDGEGAE
jgi:hypothetical protein